MSADKHSPFCSSMSSGRPNPIARNSESKDPMRRSFCGNPFAKPSSIIANSRGGFNPNTPVNSPSDFPRRSSFGKENFSSLRDNEDKENSKSSNLGPGRVQSPASASKGKKNFMSPTISAASKFTTSPRKKILAERYEPLRSSVSLSDAKSQVMEDSNVKPEICANKKKTVSFSDTISLLIEDDLSQTKMSLNEEKIEASHDSTITDMGHNEALKSDSDFDSDVPLDSKNDVDSSWENVAEKDCVVNLDPTFKISPRTSCSTSSPMLAPLDADPLILPYDPKTNYLSPRPRFLHYKPNPRIELMHNKDGKRLEESFIPENLSDSEVSETLSEDSQKESDDVSSGETVEESEGVSSGEKVEEEEESEEEEISVVPEPNTVSTHMPEESVQSKVVSKSKFFTISKFIALLVAMVFVFTAISVSDSTGTNLSVLKELSLYDLYVPPEIAQFAQVNFEGLVRKSRLWAANSFSYICDLISELRGVHKLGHLQYSNLSALLEENQLVDGYPKLAVAEFNYEENLLAPIWGRDDKTEPLEESHQEIEENEDIEEVLEEDSGAGYEEQVHQVIEVHDNIDEVLEDHTQPESEEQTVAEVIKPVVLEEDSGAGFEEQVHQVTEVHDNINGVLEGHTEPESEEQTLAEVIKPVVWEEDNGAGFEAQVHQDIEVHDNIDGVLEGHTEPESEEQTLAEVIKPVDSEAEQTEDTVQTDVSNDIKLQSNINVTDHPVVTSEVTEIQPKVYEAKEPQLETEKNSYAEIESSKAEENAQNTELDASLDNLQSSAAVDKFLTKNVVGISSLVLLSVLAAAVFFNHTKKRKLSTPNATTPVGQYVMTKKLDYSPLSVTAEKLASRNWQTEVDNDMLGESCPSEMNSFKSSSQSKKGLKTSSEAQSQERKPRKNYRRESLASSDISLSSASYGSFTTYEKIPSKHGYGDEEVVTPVRRSSRIRNQVTSSP